jgi:outer membrane protein OmpA-like peptidoglycan-associated protein
MANASKPNQGALLRRGIGIALLALGAGCTSHALQPVYPLGNSGKPVKNSQGVCVQIGPTPAGDKLKCYQLAPPDQQHHVEPLPLDEFGYLFPPLKPEPRLVSTSPPAKTIASVPVAVVPIQPATAVTVAAAPIPNVTTPIAAPAKINSAPATKTPASSISTVHYVEKALRFVTLQPFRLNRSYLSRKNRVSLLAYINSLERYRGVLSIRITGHTDKSGPKQFNNWLSEMRAKSVQQWLLSLGVDPRSTYTHGVGSSEPRPHARHAADNRYVDIEVVVRVPTP